MCGKAAQRICVIHIGPGHFGGDQGNIADILVHDGIRRKLDKQLLHVFLGFRGIGSVQEPFNIAVKEQGIENGVDTLKKVIYFPIEFLGRISGIGCGILQQQVVQRSIRYDGKNQAEGGHTPQYNLKLLLNG